MNNSPLEKIHGEIQLMKIKTYTELVDYFLYDNEEMEFILAHVDRFVAYFDNIIFDEYED